MSLLTVLRYPDPRLRKVATPISDFTVPLQRLAENMLETMYHEDGIGLAASQVNIHQRLIVMDVSETRDQPIICVNPEIEIMADAQMVEYKEGCLSVPDVVDAVDRPDHVVIHCQDIEGNHHDREARGLLAVCVQHECDHLDGKLFIDYLSILKRNRITRKLQKRSKQEHSA